MKLTAGANLPAKVLESVDGESFTVPDPIHLVHLNFRRFVDCPICNVHIGRLIKRSKDLEAAGIKEVIFFHSTPEAIRSHQKDLPFTLVADPQKKLYQEFGVESSWKSVMSLSAVQAGFLGMTKGHFGMKPQGGKTGLPADFLIAPSGAVKAVKYGKHAADQWTVDELLTLATGSPN